MKAAAAVLAIAVAATASGQSPYDDAKAAMDRRMAAERTAAEAAGDPGRVRPGDYLLVDRRARSVTVLACATQIKPADPVEFFLNPVASGKDYESLAVTFATPAAVRRALTDDLGLSPGRPVDPANDRFWPRGPRVRVTVKPAAAPPAAAVRAERLVLDARTAEPLPLTGLVFTGGLAPPDPADPAGGERPIAPTYNEPNALFDVPRQASQSAVYGRFKPSPAFAFAPGALLDVTFAVAAGDDAVPETDAVVTATVKAGRPAYRFEVDRRAQIRPAAGDFDADTLAAFTDGLAQRVDGRADVFVRVRPDDAVPVAALRSLYGVLRAVEGDRGVKLDDSGAGLPSAAFFPDPAWRDRDERPGEPWDLFLTRAPDGRLAARLERSTGTADGDAARPPESARPADPEALAAYVKAHASRFSRTLLVYPPADLTYGELLAWTRAAREAVPRAYVFPSDAAK